MKILVTGGAGFMGSNMIHHLMSRYPEYRIVNVDKLTYAGNLDNLKDLENDPRYTFVKADISDAPAMDRIFAEHHFDAIINYAAETHVDRSILNPSAFLYTEVIGTYHLLEAVRKHHIAKMIQISTDEVYGSIMNGEFTEESPLNPLNPYSAAKAGADHLCAAYAHTYRLPVIMTHSCNYIGEYQHPEKFIPLFITNLIEDKTVPVYGDGMQMREWIYTEDHCAAIDILLHRGKVGESYNLGTNHREHNINVVKMMLAILGKGEGLISYVKDRAGHDVRYAVSCEKFMKEYGWKPKYDLRESLQRTVDWYRGNEWWWKKIKNSDDFQKYYNKQYIQREEQPVA
ncbi:MAG TPA: dTDP-glucose 4,6-dehydratase [Patescibacteria group bacterium]|nr:dTDP-glucose 4,6-dehydratase [Patescibacteria group bacterium]